MSGTDDDQPPGENGESASTPSPRGPGESVLDVVARRAGINPRVLLRDAPTDESPVLRVHAQSSEEAAKDDSRYQVVGEIGRGGVGIIFKSRDRDLGRDVAMKVLRSEMAEKPHVVERFVEEAQVAGQLQHPGIVPVYGMGLQKDGRPFFTMKLVKGKTLAALLAGRRSAMEERRRFVGIFEQLCQTVAYAHARGVIHRDLKPANVMVGAFGEVQLMDWGFAKVLGRRVDEPVGDPSDSIFSSVDTVRSGSEGSQSIAGSVMGTPAYMPPEQAMGRIDALDERADVFALGSILCEVLCGKPAYTGESTEQLVQAARGKLEDAYERLDSCTASDELRELARACLAPAADARPRDAGKVAEEVAAYLSAAQQRAKEAELRAHQAKTEAEAHRRQLLEERAKTEREEAREQQRSQEAAWALRARKRGLILTALILLAVIVGGGAWHWIEDGKEARAQDAAVRVHEALRNANQLRAKGKWAEALEEVSTARAMAAEHIDDRDIAERIEVVSGQIVMARDEAKEAARVATEDARMVRVLAEISAWVSRQTDFAPVGDDPFLVESQYDNAFRGYGIDVDALGVNAAAALVRERAISEELTSAIDDWVWVRRVGCEMPRERWGRLLELAMAADDNPASQQLREAIHSSQGNMLRDAIGEVDLKALPARTLAMVGRALIQANDFTTARSILEDAQRRHPSHVGVNHYLAVAVMPRLATRDLRGGTTRADLQLALRCRSAIAAIRPDEDESWMQLGNTLLWLGRWEDGRDAFYEALRRDPTSVANHIGVGMSHGLPGGESETLERDYERTCRKLAVEPNTSAFNAGLGLGHLQMRRMQPAITYFERAVATGKDDDLWVVRFLAVGYFATGRYTEAIKSAYEGLAYPGPMHAAPAIAVRHLAFAKQDTDEALKVLDTELGPYGRGALHALRMRILARVDKYNRMIELLAPRVEAGNEPALSRVMLGSYRAFAGDAEGAHREWERAVTENPEDVRLLMQVAWLYATHKTTAARKGSRALELARKAVKLDESSWTARASLVAALRASGDLAQAKQQLRSFLQTRAVAGLWRDAGRVWDFVGEPELAGAAYLEAARLFPTDASTLNAVAWAGVMTDSGDPVVPLDKALELAAKAVEIASKESAFRNTLAHLSLRKALTVEGEERTKLLETAVSETNISTSIRGRLHADDGFVLAMALWHLDKKPEARKTMAQALEALIAIRPEEERDTLRTRDEALRLIGKVD